MLCACDNLNDKIVDVSPENAFSGDTEPNSINYLRWRFSNFMVAAATWLIRPLALATLFQCARDL